MDNNKQQRAIYVDDKLWNEAVQKSNQPKIDRSLSQIIRRLLEMWVGGEVKPYPERFIDEQNN